jgi:putative ABC transport system substrate-binding protein
MVRRLADHGWVEGQNIVFECVSTLGRVDQVPTLAGARELVSRRPDVLTAEGYWAVKVLKQETTTIPIVMLSTGDPVRNGIITNLARPEGNVTGVAWYSYELIPKRIELLKEIVPYLRRLAFVGVYGDPEYAQRVKESITIAAGKLGFSWQLFEILANDYDEIFARLAAEHFDAAYIQANPLNNKNLTRISQLAVHHLIPTIGEWEGLAKGGLLLSYGQSYSRDLKLGAEYIDKILRGAKPSELPVEQTTTFLQVINLKTAKVLGLTVPPSLIARADEVIE